MSSRDRIPYDAYRELAETPSYKSAEFHAPNVIRVTTSTTDYVRKLARRNVKTFVITDDAVSVVTSPDGSEIVASITSPSGKYLAVLRETEGKKRFVEVWRSDRIVAVEEVTEKHGAFYTDDFFSSVSFSPSERRIVYVAEANAPELTSKDGGEPFASSRFVPPLGEGYGTRSRPTIYLFDWSNASKHQVKSLVFDHPPSAPTVLPAQPLFVSEDKVLCTAFELSPDGRVLGIIYCSNRAASVWTLDIPPSLKDEDEELICPNLRLTSADSACLSPRLLTVDNRQQAVWLSSAAGGPHAKSSALNIRDETGITRILVDRVRVPGSTQFPGLYTSTFPRQPFVQLPAPYVLTSSIWHSRNVVLLISLEDGNIVNLTPEDEELWSWNVLCTDGKTRVVCSRSAPNHPHELVLGTLDFNKAVTWRVIARPELSEELQAKLSALTSAIVSIPNRGPTQTIVLRTKASSANAPCVTMIHGGPHSASTTGFNTWNAAMALEGYTISSPNYTGSVGFGDTWIEQLCGRVGDLDVKDCMETVDHLVSLGIAQMGDGQQLLSGGSHGGFLVTHLIGQYPDVFSATLARNPVTHLGSPDESDIPDWYYAVLGELFTPTSILTPALYEKAFRLSPIAHVDRVRTPLVLMLGLKDQRVAPNQGKLYYHALKGRGRDVQMLCFPEDVHALDGVEAQRAAFDVGKALFARVQKGTTAKS